MYQRGIFGYQGEAEVQEKAEVVDGETDENEVQMEMVVEPTQPDDTAESPGTLLSDEQPSQERETVSSERQKLREEEELDPEEVREEEKQDDYLEKAESVPEKVIEGSEEESVTEEIKLRDPHAKEVEEFSPDFEKPSLESKSEESGQVNLQFPATDAKELSPEEIERIMDRGKTWGVHGLTKKEQVVYRSEIARLKADRLEVRRVLDKEFDKGIDSLTDEERVVYEQEQARRTEWRRRNKKAKPKKPDQFRLILAAMFLFLAENSIGNGFASFFFFFCLLIVYVIHPWISFWMGEDPCIELFETRFLREKKFRRGGGLFLLSLCLFPSALVLAFPLFCFSIMKIYGSKTFEDFRKSLLK